LLILTFISYEFRAAAGFQTLKINNPKLSSVAENASKLITYTLTGAPGISGGMSLHSSHLVAYGITY
jgi:hypothetical protein